MTIFEAPDGTSLAYRSVGSGDPLVCLPGGPMQASSYLGDLGGLDQHRMLALLDLRGTGESAVPADTSTYRVDRQVADVEALRVHLGLGQMDLLAHSAGGALAVLYAAQHPEHVGRLVLVCPSPRVVDVEITDADRRELAERRSGEPWFPAAYAAFERIWAGSPSDDDWDAITPFAHGRWDDERRAYVALEAELQNVEAARGYYAEGVPDPAGTRSAVAALGSSVLLVAGEHDVALPPVRAAEYVRLFGRAELAVMTGAGHSPWLDDPATFVRTVADFLG